MYGSSYGSGYNSSGARRDNIVRTLMAIHNPPPGNAAPPPFGGLDGLQGGMGTPMGAGGGMQPQPGPGGPGSLGIAAPGALPQNMQPQNLLAQNLQQPIESIGQPPRPTPPGGGTYF